MSGNMFRLALDTGAETIRIGDEVIVWLKIEKEPFVCTLVGLFRSVHPPYEIRLQLANSQFSVGEEDIGSISKTKRGG